MKHNHALADMQIHVIIPVYNCVNYVRQAVESVLNQPYKRIAIVMVDDGSTDGSSWLCDQLALEYDRIHVIHKENQGVSVARNAGIDYVLSLNKDGYIAFLDADDCWNVGVFTKELLERIRSEQTTDVFIFGGISSNEECNRFSRPTIYEERYIEGGSTAIWKPQGHFCANLYHVYLFREWGIRFQEGLKYSEDKIFMMQCVFLARTVHFMPQILHIYRQNTFSAMAHVQLLKPIEYYPPIIDGWIASDMFLNQFKDETHKTIRAGFVLAGIYFMDMITDHYKLWGSEQELQTIKQHPYYYLFENMRPNDLSQKQRKNHQFLLHHPRLYRCKYNIIGAIEYIARSALQIKLLRDFRMRIKCPLTQLP